MTLLRVLATLLITTHEAPSTDLEKGELAGPWRDTRPAWCVPLQLLGAFVLKHPTYIYPKP